MLVGGLSHIYQGNKQLLLELPDLTNKNVGCLVKFEFQINNEYLFSISMLYAIFGICEIFGTYLY